MKLAAKLSLALALTFLVTFGAAWWAMRAAVLPEFERLEAANHASDERRVEAQLHGLARDMRARAIDYAQWDDTYRYLRGSYPNFIRANFPNEWFAKYDVDLLMFTDSAGRPVWSGLRDPQTNQIGAAPRVFQNLPSSGELTGAASATVLWTQSGPLAYATAKATRTDGSGAPVGMVIIGRFIRPAALADQVQLDVSLVAANEAPLSARHAMFANGDAGVASWTTADAAHSLIALRDSFGRIVGAVYARSPRHVTALGQQAIDLAAAAIAIGAGLSLALLWWLIHHFAVRRIANLERHLAEQGGASDLRELQVPPSRDEIGALGRAYNSLARRLYEARVAAEAATVNQEIATNTNRMKSAFMANISHELRTPLNAVIGYSELIEEELTAAGRTQTNEDLQRIRASANQVLLLANEILELSNIDADKIELRPNAFSPVAMIGEIAESAKRQADENGTQLNIVTAPHMGMAYTDEHRLSQCLKHVVDNACKFTRGGVVTVTSSRIKDNGQDMFVFEVADTGVGIPDAELARLFEPFSHAVALPRPHGGAGLGLSITQKLLRLLGGDISVSTEVGRGSVFVIRAPCVLRDGASAEASRRSA